MKNILRLLMIGIIFSSFINVSKTTDYRLENNAVFKSNGSMMASAVKVTPTDYTLLCDAFQLAHEGGTYGGTMKKSSMQSLLSAMPSGAEFINFRFGTDSTYNKVSLMIKGEATALRNGNSETAFCPTMCSVTAPTTDNTIQISIEAVEMLSNQYQEANPGSTFGGNIDISALQEIISSLPEENDNFSFRFCTDEATGMTSIIFVGGTVGQSNNENLYYRNGLNADAFCPTTCSRH